MKLTGPLKFGFKFIVAALILGLAVVIGILVGSYITGAGVSIDAIASGTGSMIGAILTVGAALFVYRLQELRAEQRRKDDLRPHALQLIQLATEIGDEFSGLGVVLPDGEEVSGDEVRFYFGDHKAIVNCVSVIRKKTREAALVPVPGTSKFIEDIFGVVGEMELLNFEFEEHSEQFFIRTSYLSEMRAQITQAEEILNAVMEICEQYC